MCKKYVNDALNQKHLVVARCFLVEASVRDASGVRV